MGAQSADADGRGEKRAALEAHLRDGLADGTHYFKSREIARHTDLSPSQVGALFRQLRDSPSPFSVEKWAYSGCTTWRVERDRS